MIYLDEAATTPVRREVLEAMWPYLTADFGNPSSHHGLGESAERGLSQARAAVAKHFAVHPSEVIFTSGGTESINQAIKGIAWAAPRGRHIVTSAVEHNAVLKSVAFLQTHGFEVTQVPVDRTGRIDPADVASSLRDDTTLVSVQYANNEVGTIQPIAQIAQMAAARGVPLHTDAVQAVGTLPMHDVGAQAISISGHKIGGPKGSGALICDRKTLLEPLIHGGGQENEHRSGTENVAGAVGLATALTAVTNDANAIATLRDAFVERILNEVPGSELTGHRSARLAGIASFVFPDLNGEAILLELQARGIMCSSGSACSAGSEDPSHVLTAMGYESDIALTAVRFSFGASTTAEHLDRAVSELKTAVGRISNLAT